MDPDECLLRDVHGLVRVLRHGERQLDHPALIPLHQRAKGFRVAGLRRFDQRPIVARPVRTLTHTDALDWSKFTRVPGARGNLPGGRIGEARARRESSTGQPCLDLV